MWMVEDILLDLPSASRTQLEASPEGAKSAPSLAVRRRWKPLLRLVV